MIYIHSWMNKHFVTEYNLFFLSYETNVKLNCGIYKSLLSIWGSVGTLNSLIQGYMQEVYDYLIASLQKCGCLIKKIQWKECVWNIQTPSEMPIWALLPYCLSTVASPHNLTTTRKNTSGNYVSCLWKSLIYLMDWDRIKTLRYNSLSSMRSGILQCGTKCRTAEKM